ncbi:hypothetical protein RQP46_000637 [Phenoliferia psychrophenolica]
MSKEEHHHHHFHDGGSMGVRLSYEGIQDERFGIHAAGVLALSSILANVDEMDDIVSELCGQESYTGYQQLHHHHIDSPEE